jgi:hypothetical protein
MSFSPSVYGERTATALNSLAGQVEFRGDRSGFFEPVYHIITEPEGTLLEADLLLSCNLAGKVPLFNLMGFLYTDENLLKVQGYKSNMLAFFGDPARFTTLNESRKKPHDREKAVAELKEMIVGSVLEYRKSIRETVEPEKVSTGPAFSNSLFGPHVAKVMNSLFELEIQLSTNDNAHLSGQRLWFSLDEQRIKSIQALVRSHEHSKEHKVFALQSRKGTAFAGDMLVLKYFMDLDRTVLKSEAAQEFRDSLLPEFGRDPYGNEMAEQTNIHQALHNVRKEMWFVHKVVHGQALPVLMAGIPRLGSGSVLSTVDKEVLCMIARLVIFG